MRGRVVHALRAYDNNLGPKTDEGAVPCVNPCSVKGKKDVWFERPRTLCNCSHVVAPTSGRDISAPFRHRQECPYHSQYEPLPFPGQPIWSPRPPSARVSILCLPCWQWTYLAAAWHNTTTQYNDCEIYVTVLPIPGKETTASRIISAKGGNQKCLLEIPIRF